MYLIKCTKTISEQRQISFFLIFLMGDNSLVVFRNFSSEYLILRVDIRPYFGVFSSNTHFCCGSEGGPDKNRPCPRTLSKQMSTSRLQSSGKLKHVSIQMSMTELHTLLTVTNQRCQTSPFITNIISNLLRSISHVSRVPSQFEFPRCLCYLWSFTLIQCFNNDSCLSGLNCVPPKCWTFLCDCTVTYFVPLFIRAGKCFGMSCGHMRTRLTL
jgi:hypothetical protein